MTSSNPDGCPRTEDAGAYLLGSLEPGERADFAAHLQHCPFCLREVGQLGGLPGLLARSPGPPRGVRQMPVIPPPATPDEARESSTLASTLREIQRRRAHRRTLLAAAFVLVAVVGAGASTLGERALTRPSTEVTAAAQLPVRMQPIGETDVSAALALNEKAWGTEVIMRCRYGGAAESTRPVYVLVARAADGSTAELARWAAIPDRDVVLATATDVPRQQLASLEVRDMRGTVVLRTDHI